MIIILQHLQVVNENTRKKRKTKREKAFNQHHNPHLFGRRVCMCARVQPLLFEIMWLYFVINMYISDVYRFL